MQRLTSIVAMNHEGAIGAGNMLPWRLRTDMAFFRAATLAMPVVLGRKTYESLGSKPLPQRANIVLSHNFGLHSSFPNVDFAHSVEEGLFAANRLSRGREAYVIGGASLYNQLHPFVDRYLITLVDMLVDQADAFFGTGLLDDANWEIAQSGFVPADAMNEAPFTVFELLNRDPIKVRQRRSALIEDQTRRVQRGASGRKRHGAGMPRPTNLIAQLAI